MRARDLAEPFPVVTLDTDAMEAARLLGRRRLPGLIVCDRDGRPYTVLPGSQVLRFLVPATFRTTCAGPGVRRAGLRRAVRQADEQHRRTCSRRRDLDELPVVDDDATTSRSPR